MIDTHAHLTSRQYDRDRDAVIERARKAGVSKIITVGTDSDDWDKAVLLAEKHDDIHVVIGLHPHDAEGATDAVFQKLESLVSKHKVLALGEIGLDFYRNYSARDAQEDVFREQIRLAHRVGLPIVIHSREASEPVLKILEEENAADLGGVFHCLPADAELAQEGERMGFYLSLAGAITYDGGARDAIVRMASPDRLLVETDCPYLTPAPARRKEKGKMKRNEPAFVSHTVQKLAEILMKSPKEVDDLTTANALRAFRLAG